MKFTDDTTVTINIKKGTPKLISSSKTTIEI